MSYMRKEDVRGTQPGCGTVIGVEGFEAQSTKKREEKYVVLNAEMMVASMSRFRCGSVFHLLSGYTANIKASTRLGEVDLRSHECREAATDFPMKLVIVVNLWREGCENHRCDDVGRARAYVLYCTVPAVGVLLHPSFDLLRPSLHSVIIRLSRIERPETCHR